MKHAALLPALLAILAAAADARPQDAKKYIDSAHDKFMKGELDGALADATFAIEIDPKLPLAFFIRALAKAGMEKNDAALADFDKAIELDPKDMRFYYQRAIVRDVKGDVPGALADYGKAIELKPKDASLYASRAYLNFDRHAWAEAMADFRTSIELDPRRPEYRQLRLWVARSRLGEKEAASKELTEQFAARKAEAQEDWVSSIARFLTGRIEEAAFLKSAEVPDADKTKERQCEAFFYAACRKAVEGDAAGALDFFRKCVGTGVSNYTEFASAAAELKSADRKK